MLSEQIFTIQTSHEKWSTSPAHMSLIMNDGYSQNFIFWDQLAVFDMPSGIKRRFKILDNDFKWLAQNETISDRCSYSKKYIYFNIYNSYPHYFKRGQLWFCGESIFVSFLSSFYVLNFFK